MKIHELVEGVEYKVSNCEDSIYQEDLENMIFIKNRHGLFSRFKNEDEVVFVEADFTYNTVIDLEFTEFEFKPMDGEDYYYPCFDDEGGYGFAVWRGDSIDSNIKKVVGVYRTREQAIEKARELGWIE